VIFRHVSNSLQNRALGALGLAMLALLAGACTPAPREPAPLDPQLIRLAGQHPDSVVGVLIQVSRSVGEAERAALSQAGVRVGTVVGDVVTGEVRAGRAAAVARLDFVAYVELAAVLRPLPGRGALRGDKQEGR
jgi:hypothetical protein